MSYARFVDADVYVFESCYGTLDCCGCSLEGGSQSFLTTAEMLEHLAKHVAAGHDVPDYCIEGLKADAAENDAFNASVAAGMCASCGGTGECRDYQPHDPKNSAGCVFCGGTKRCWQCSGKGGSDEWAARRGTTP